MEQTKITLKGKVQGVFFRDFAKQHANKLGLKGYAKNLRNGNLRIVVVGPEKQVKEFTRTCKMGPVVSKVEEYEVITEPAEEEYEYFDIKR